jgi:uncharacterized membrane protein
MSLLASVSPNILVHLGAALSALALGVVQFLLKKGTRSHRTLGYIWVALMYCTAITSLFISQNPWVGPFGPIHILSLVVMISLPMMVRAARQGNIQGHKLAAMQLFGFGLIGAGAFAALEPGRVLHQLLFG